MEVEYCGGGVLIFSYLIIIHQRDTFGGLYDNQVEPRQLVTSEFIGCRFDDPPIACKRGLRVASWPIRWIENIIYSIQDD